MEGLSFIDSSAGETAPGAGPARADTAPRYCPLRRVVVGVCEGQASHDALALARAFLDELGSHLIAASVRPYWPGLLGPERYCRLVEEDIEKTASAVRQVVGGAAFSTRIVAGGHEGGGLTRLAVAEGADLIVLGSSRNGSAGLVTPGGLAERILETATCAVALAPRGVARRQVRLRELAVAIDGSRESRGALKLAFAIAEAAGAHLSILGAVEPEPDPGAPGASSRRLIRETRIRTHIDQARREAPTALSVSPRLMHGPAARVLSSATSASDLLILGSRSRYSSSRSLSLGSVARQVIRHARSPVLIATPS